MGLLFLAIGLLTLPLLIMRLERPGELSEVAKAAVEYCSVTGRRLLRKGLKAISASVQVRLAIAAIARTALNQGMAKREQDKQRKRKTKRSS